MLASWSSATRPSIVYWNKLWRRVYPYLGSLAVFGITLGSIYAYWALTAGRWADTKQWPRQRTNFVLTVVAMSIWAPCMVVLTVIWRVFVPLVMSCVRRRRLRREQYVSLPMHTATTEVHDGEEDGDRNPSFESETDTLLEREAADKPSPDQTEGRLFRGWWIRLAIYFQLTMVGAYLWCTREWEPDWKHRSQVDLAANTKPPEGLGNGGERTSSTSRGRLLIVFDVENVYIVAMFHDNADLIPFWTSQMTRLIYYLGTKHVYVSIVESYSKDSTAEQLERFEERLTVMGVDHTLRLRDTSIPKKKGSDRRHIRFLSGNRNLAMQPLRDMAGQGRLFDKVLWTNDVFVHAEAVVELLRTRDGKYDQACGIDFNFFGLYDMWVLRDRLGGIGSSLYPYFFEEVGMRMVMRDEPAPVFSCWNGILAATAEPFVPPEFRRRNATALSQAVLSPPLPPTHPRYDTHRTTPPFDQPALMFRDSEPKECFSSESFNMPYDLRRQFLLNRIYLVPSVITTYHYDKYIWFKYFLRHWLAQWYIKNVENGRGMHLAKIILGWAESVYVWDGGHCMAVSAVTPTPPRRLTHCVTAQVQSG
ncbi:hypothetical protein AURDEDRAFT_125002 [Auricularia subglabra TFB-10046 SS5]|nr:hypothetical protein AURDEDRAFT_125002 [Auricularia subglabra TFB-10046 SS5]